MFLEWRNGQCKASIVSGRCTKRRSSTLNVGRTLWSGKSYLSPVSDCERVYKMHDYR